MAKVTLKDLWKVYGKNVEAVKDLNLEAQDGEILCLLGPSGCGKTTTLRMVAGLETPTKGEIYIGEKLINEIPPKDREIAMIFEDYLLYPSMTVYENIAFPLKIRKIPSREIHEKIYHVAKMMHIEGILNEGIVNLGGGQQQSVSVAKALVRDPQVFLLDEPISHLDAELKANLRAELKRELQEIGTTSLFVTHDQLEAMSIGDRIAIMNQGLLQQVGSPEEVFNQPSNTFVAGFIGEPPMNLLNCQLIKKANEIVAEGSGWEIVLPKKRASKLSKLPETRKVVLGVRPLDLRLYAEDSASFLEGSVFFVENVGDRVLIMLEMAQQERIIIDTIFQGDMNYHLDDTVKVIVNTDKIHLFDASTGVALGS
jgi:multiple sugar transport system ATP-binding protein